MSKVTSRDCIQFIIAQVVMEELANPKNWIRTEKKKVDKNSIIRVFKNKKTGLEVEVMEDDGVINKDLVIFNNQWVEPNNPEKNWDGDKILFCLTKAIPYRLSPFKNYNIYQMYVVEEEYYKEYKALDTGIDTGPICELLKDNGFGCCEFVEGGIEFYTDINIDALKDYLAKSKVFTTNDAFQKWMGSFPEYKVINIKKAK